MKHVKVSAIFITILVGLSLLIYLRSLPFGFVLDDHQGIEKNLTITDPLYVLQKPQLFLFHPIWHLTYLIQGFEPAGFRLLNILAHLLTVVTGYFLIKKLYRSDIIAFVAAAVFSIHPILVESVVWISSLSYPMYAWSGLTSLALYVHYTKNHQKKYLGFSLLFFFFSVFSSEKALVLAGFFMLYEFTFGSVRKNWKRLSLYFLVLLAPLFLVLHNLQSRISSFSASAVSGKTDILNPLQQIPIVLGTYLQLTFWPQNLTIYHLDEQ